MSNVTYGREQELLGWMMIQSSLPDGIMALKAEWFSDELHRQVFGSIVSLAKRGADYLAPMVSDHLDAEFPIGPVERDERAGYVWDLSTKTHAVNVKYLIKSIRDGGQRREFRNALLDAVHVVEEHDSYPDAVSAALSRLDGVVMQGASRGLLTASDLNRIGLEWIKDRFESGGALPGLSTGYDDLDNVIYGLKPGELITIAGATSMGKTTFATNVAEAVARDAEVLVISREMGETQIAIRHFASQGDVSMNAIQKAEMTPTDMDNVAVAVSKIDRLKLTYDLDSSTPNQIALRARQLKRQRGSLGLIVVDSIGLLQSDKNRRAKYEEVTDITWALKNLAREMNLPVIQLAQINRAVSSRADKRPTLADLSDSSSIEKDSDVVIGMYRDDYYHADSHFKGMGEAIVLKNRMGECKRIGLVFDGARNKFKPCAYGEFDRMMAASQETETEKNEPRSSALTRRKP